MNTRFNFTLSTDQDEWLRQQAFEQRVSKADIVRGLIDRAMKEDHTMARYEVIEDNAGGLHLFVFGSDSAIVYAADNWETSPGALRESLEELRRTGTTEGWDGMDRWDELGITPEESYAKLQHWIDEGMGGAQLIADQHGTYPNRMGEAGKRELLTTAERIAEKLGNDGMRFETEDGRALDELLDELTEEADGRIIKHETKELWRYLFPDGSAIVASPNCWDIEGSTPWSWAGAE